MLIQGKTHKRIELNINLQNIVRHPVNPTGISVSLVEWDKESGKYTVSINLKDFNSTCYTQKRFSKKNEAEKYYKDVINCIETNAYKLHIFDSGEATLEI